MSAILHAVFFFGYAIMSLAIALVLPDMVEISRVQAGLVGGLTLTVGIQVHLLTVFAFGRKKQIAKLDEVQGEFSYLYEEIGRLQEETRELKKDMAETSAQPAEDLVSEVRMLQTLLSQVVTRSKGQGGGLLQGQDLKGDEKSSKGVLAGLDESGLMDDDLSKLAKNKDGSRHKEVDAIYEIIRNALVESRIDLYLQPIVRLPSRQTLHYECFSRVRDEGGQIIFPTEFLPVAEDAGLVGTLDNVILFRCMHLVRGLGRRRPGVRFFCNISLSSVNDDEFFPDFVEYMTRNRDLADRLVFEFSQQDFRHMTNEARNSLGDLGDRGFRFSLDQVSDLSLDARELSAAHVEWVKIDAEKMLFGQGDIDPHDLPEALRRQEINLVVSRVEDEATIVDVLDFDVEYGQGYLFGKPRMARPNERQDGSAADRKTI